jgi:hypothetical protein
LTPAIRAIVLTCRPIQIVNPALTLALLVPWVLADHPHDSLAPDDLAVAADLLH